jgi:hypothetical protein
MHHKINQTNFRSISSLSKNKTIQTLIQIIVIPLGSLHIRLTFALGSLKDNPSMLNLQGDIQGGIRGGFYTNPSLSK